MNINTAIEILVGGLSMGSTYAMIALGYTMVYGIAKMLNFAHGDVIMIGAYMIHTAIMMKGNPLLGLALSLVVCTVLGIVIEKVAYKPLRGASPLAVLITAIGVSNLLQAVIQLPEPIGYGPAPITIKMDGLGSLKLGEVAIPYYAIITLACSAVIMIILTLFVKYTRTGRAMIAVSEDRGAAQLMGINVNRIIMITFAIGSFLAAFASFFRVLESPSIDSTLGAMPGIKAFTAAVIGGIGSIPGAMLGGILLGVVEAVTVLLNIEKYTIAVEFLVLIVILLVKPSGILGKVRREKV